MKKTLNERISELMITMNKIKKQESVQIDDGIVRPLLIAFAMGTITLIMGYFNKDKIGILFFISEAILFWISFVLLAFAAMERIKCRNPVFMKIYEIIWRFLCCLFIIAVLIAYIAEKMMSTLNAITVVRYPFQILIVSSLSLTVGWVLSLLELFVLIIFNINLPSVMTLMWTTLLFGVILSYKKILKWIICRDIKDRGSCSRLVKSLYYEMKTTFEAVCIILIFWSYIFATDEAYKEPLVSSLTVVTLFMALQDRIDGERIREEEEQNAIIGS